MNSRRLDNLITNNSGNVGVIALKFATIVLLLGSCLFGVMTVKHYRSVQSQIENGDGIDTSIPVKSSKRIRPTIKSVEPLAYYLSDLKKRDLFQAPWEKKKEEIVKPEPEIIQDTQSVMEFTQSIRLVGIISDNNPRAVIEDLVNNETLFVSVGDLIKGARLDQIFGEKVIFKIGTETVELYP